MRERVQVGADPEIFKRGDALCRSPLLAGRENFRFQMTQKGQNNVRNYKFLANYFYQYFQIFPILTIKSYQFFKIY